MDMDFNLLKPQIKNRYVHTSNQALRKCCGCIHLRVGAVFSCIIWAALSLYFAIISFQDQSPFFSYMPREPVLVFGVANLILTLVSLGGLFALFMDRWEVVRRFSHAVWVSIFLVLVDGLVNVILFITVRNDFQDWCISASSNHLQHLLPNSTDSTNFDYQGGDFYNCDKLWQDELKFSFMAIILMMVLYVYWAACIYSFSHKKGAVRFTAARMGDPAMAAAAGAMPAPPPPMMPAQFNGNGNAPGMMPPMPPQGMPNRSNIIVLQNEKPRSKTKKSIKKPSFSFRNMKPRRLRNTVHTLPSEDYLFDFKIASDGHVIDFSEMEPEPARTDNASKTKRKPLPDSYDV
ncbi:uncharacterized protein BYT42DRAFT_609940 [Radiomyces spectabilis]|uniref:uncharacterized protein n=1 Tax=Radiomyces spectabilis TaxID=64574 RepID=UPI00222064CB|nr:uncharacterized protein BYT42DRAFT_609940 [Radiomyces spectabilis]KAI8394205.1 hypothetical protein BYT42DRAFT_609940 [Radiomyces spectabilis]